MDDKWEEFVGKPWQETQAAILNKYPNMSIQVLPEGSMVTMDYRPDRVRIFVNGDGIVVTVPRIG